MEDARRRWQEKQDAKAAKYIEDKKLVSIIILLILFTIFFNPFTARVLGGVLYKDDANF